MLFVDHSWYLDRWMHIVMPFVDSLPHLDRWILLIIMSLVDHSQHFSTVGCASLCHTGRLDRWIHIVMSIADHRPLDARRPLLKLSSSAKLPKRRTKETQEKIGAYFVSSSILGLDFDLLRFPEEPGRPSCVAVAGASLVVSLKGKIVSNLFLPSNDILISDSLWLFR